MEIRPTERTQFVPMDRQVPRVFVWLVGESVMQNLENRWSRPVEAYREVAQKAMDAMGVQGKLRWRQKAGCSCGCSPGFVVENATGFGRRDLHVHAEVVEMEVVGC